MARTKKTMVRKSEGAKHFITKPMQKRGTPATGGLKTTQIPSGNSGTEANQAIPDVYGIADSKTAIPLACEGDSTEHQMGYVPDTSYSVGFTGGS